MNDTFVTFRGWAGSDVRHRVAKGVSVATLRVAATPRLKKDGEWVDGETTWYSVTAWRTLADNLLQSVRKGDPVIVHGRLRTETWAPEEGPASTTLQVEALLVGHDLTRGMSHYYRSRRDAPGHGVPERTEEGTEETTVVDVANAPDDTGDDHSAEPGEHGEDGVLQAQERAAAHYAA